MNNIVRFTIATPFIVFIINIIIGFVLLRIIGDPYTEWEDNGQIEIMEPIGYSDLFLSYLLLSLSLFTCCFNIKRRIRRNGILSFLSFFWLILLMIVLVMPFILFFWSIHFYFISYIVTLTVYFVWFRIRVSKGYFEKIADNE